MTIKTTNSIKYLIDAINENQASIPIDELDPRLLNRIWTYKENCFYTDMVVDRIEDIVNNRYELEPDIACDLIEFLTNHASTIAHIFLNSYDPQYSVIEQLEYYIEEEITTYLSDHQIDY